ncbi:hypothetical protein M3J09_010450 [Ascochyta lentis]
MSDHQPTLIFIPGSWHKPTCYKKVIDTLEERYRLKCIAVTLPSTTGNPESTFKDDLDAARTAIALETTQGRNVIVIAHSYGGMVANSAIKNFTLPRDDSASRSPRKDLPVSSSPGPLLGSLPQAMS